MPVTVGSNPWLAEYVPSSAHSVAPFEYRIALIGAALLKMTGGTDAGYAGSYN